MIMASHAGFIVCQTVNYVYRHYQSCFKSDPNHPPARSNVDTPIKKCASIRKRRSGGARWAGAFFRVEYWNKNMMYSSNK